MQTFETIEIQTAGDGIALVFFNRPEAANALNTQMAKELAQFFHDPHVPSLRTVILAARGRHFCAGADLKERKGMSETQWHTQHHAFEEALRAIMLCTAPVIAAVNGAAYGGGLELALACDFIYASENARFALPETTLGIIPGLGGTQTLPRAIGIRRARELIYQGQTFSADEARTWGMVNRLCGHDSLLDNALACATTISRNAPLALRAAKHAMNEGIAMTLTDALACELKHYGTLLATRDRHEGINAFNEKRPPSFTGE